MFLKQHYCKEPLIFDGNDCLHVKSVKDPKFSSIKVYNESDQSERSFKFLNGNSSSDGELIVSSINYNGEIIDVQEEGSGSFVASKKFVKVKEVNYINGLEEYMLTPSGSEKSLLVDREVYDKASKCKVSEVYYKNLQKCIPIGYKDNKGNRK